MALRDTRSEISESLGMYWVLTKIPAPTIAIWGAFAISSVPATAEIEPALPKMGLSLSF